MRFLSPFTLVALGFITNTSNAASKFPEGKDCMRTTDIKIDLAPRLSSNATIALKSNESAHFDELTLRYATNVNPDLTAFISVGTGEDVGEIIKYALATNHPVLAGNRRHGWSQTLNRVNGAIMIDISPLTGIAINSTANTVTVGGGVNVGSIMSALQAAGKETSAGICNCVGFIGATLGGGLGLSQGRYGLMLDNLLSVQLTTATGETMTVSETSQPELFWGLRGAGHNFGIVTEATYRIHDAANEGMQYKADVYFDPEYLKEVFQALNDYDVPAETNAILSFILDSDIKKPVMWLNFISSTPEAAASAELESVFGHIPYLRRTSEMLPWARVNDEILTKGACASRARKVASGVSAKTWDIPSIQDAFDRFKEFIELPGTETTIIMFEAYSVKGVQKVPAENTAYPWREEIGVVVLNVVYDDTKLDAQAADWLFEVMAILHADSGFERPAVYVNYAQGTEGFGAMYGHEEWRQERLKDLKRKWDPKCMFSGYNPIPIKCQE